MIFDLSIPDIVVPIISSNIVLCSNTMYASKREELKEEIKSYKPPYSSLWVRKDVPLCAWIFVGSDHIGDQVTRQ